MISKLLQNSICASVFIMVFTGAAAAASIDNPASAVIPSGAPTASEAVAPVVAKAVAKAVAPVVAIAAEPTPLPPGTHATASIIAPLAEMNSGVIVPQLVNDADLWERIRRGFVMNELNMPQVVNQEQFYAQKQDYIKRFVARGSRYLYYIVEELERRNLPTEIALLPIIESAFNPQAASIAKASGMWQFIPSTGVSFGLKQDWHADHRRDVMLSTNAALDYLQKLYGMFNSWELAFAAYNCGEGCVSRAIQANQRRGLPTDFASLNLPNETRSYVPKLIAVKNIVLSPASYGVELTAVNNKPYFSKVTAPAKIDIKLAAKLAEMAEDEFSALNPAFNRPVAESDTGYFLVPTENAELFSSNLQLYQSLNGPMVSWQTVTARKGEAVNAVARRYGMTGSYLRATGGPFAERKGKFAKPATFMVPMAGQVKAMTAMLDKKTALKNAQRSSAAPAHLSMALNASAPSAASASAKVATAANLEPTPYAPSAATMMPHTPTPVHAAVAVPTSASVATFAEPTAGTLAINSTASSASNALAGANVNELATSNKRALATQKKIIRPALYVVRSGDTLYAIATKFNVGVDNLLRWNRLKSRSVLAVGYRLRLAA
jgi:membrane-bound lytic murein transglycosylase D